MTTESLAQGDMQHYVAGLRERLPCLVPASTRWFSLPMWQVREFTDMANRRREPRPLLFGDRLNGWGVDVAAREDPESILLRDERRRRVGLGGGDFEDPWEVS